MADTEITVTGEMELPSTGEKPGLLNFTNLPISGPAAQQWLGSRRENIRPWTTFLNSNNFKVPQSLPRLSKRIIRNIEHFQSNYLFVFVGLIIYCLLTSPLLLIAVGISLGFCYHLSKKQGERKLTLFGKEVSLAQQYGIVAVCSVPVFMWAGAGAAVFWVLGASFLIVTLHAAFFNIESVVKSDDEFNLLEEV